MASKKDKKKAKRAKAKAKQGRINRNSIQKPTLSRMKKPRMRVLNPQEVQEAVEQGQILAKVEK